MARFLQKNIYEGIFIYLSALFIFSINYFCKASGGVQDRNRFSTDKLTNTGGSVVEDLEKKKFFGIDIWGRYILAHKDFFNKQLC